VNRLLKTSLSICLITLLTLLIFTSIAFSSSPQPVYIYYDNLDRELVKANYSDAVRDLINNGNSTLRDAIRQGIFDAFGTAGRVLVEDSEGNVIDYLQANRDGVRYPEAAKNLDAYGIGEMPVLEKELVLNPITGQAEEEYLLKVASVESIHGTTVELGTTEVEVIDKLQVEVNALLDDPDQTEVTLQVSWEADHYNQNEARSYDFLYTLSPGTGEKLSFKIPADLKTGTAVVVISDDQEVSEINFADQNLEEALREVLNKPEEPILESDMLDLAKLDLNDKKIVSLEGLEYAENLERLDLANNQLSDISVLEYLVKLKKLQLEGNQIDDISALGTLVDLEEIFIARNKITDINVLSTLEKLTVLDLEDNQLQDILVLGNMHSLKKLWLCHNDISDLTVLAELVELEWLYFENNRATDLSVLEGLEGLKRLSFKGNQVEDITPLVQNKGLGSGDRLDMRSNLLNLSIGSHNYDHIEALQDRGVEIDYIPQPWYGITGVVKDIEGEPAGGVEMTFTGDYKPVVTGSDGKWVKNNLESEVTVTPVLEGCEFKPASITLSEPQKEVNFTKIVLENTLQGSISIEHNWPGSVLDDIEGLEFEERVELEIDLYSPEKETEEAAMRQVEEEKKANQFIVEFEPGITNRAREEVLKDLGAEVVDKIEERNTYLLELPERAADRQTHAALKSPAISYMEPNYFAEALYEVPDDPYYSLQWHYPQIRLPQAWHNTRGSQSIRIAVFDTGIDAAHPDLAGKVDIESGYNFVDNNRDTRDVAGHGTSVSGIIGAHTNNQTGIAGLMWETELVPIKVLSDSGRGDYFDIIDAIYYAAGLSSDPAIGEPVDIINMSLGGTGSSAAMQKALKAARDAGVLIIASSGNDDSSRIRYPAFYPETIAVGAVNYNDGNKPQRASYSNYGSALDLVAPGGDRDNPVLSTALDNNGYGYYAGTSMAAPHVAGVAGLMLSNGIDQAEVRDILHRTSMNLGEEDFHPYFGHGLVNAYWAVNDVDEVRVLVGERRGDQIEAVQEISFDLGDKNYSLTNISPGTHRVYAWIDVQGTGTIEAGDYIAKTEEILFNADGDYIFDLVLKEYNGIDLSGYEVSGDNVFTVD